MDSFEVVQKEVVEIHKREGERFRKLKEKLTEEEKVCPREHRNGNLYTTFTKNITYRRI